MHESLDRDHPRLCGEKMVDVDTIAIASGSPPPVRGKGVDCGTVQGVLRITPACAGKSPNQRCQRPEDQDHPRLCGEKQIDFDGKWIKPGSPPPVRGKDRRRAGPLRAPGITPACAGKSHIATVLRETFKDHPRLCGEKNDILVAPPTHLGSPPPVRGKD